MFESVFSGARRMCFFAHSMSELRVEAAERYCLAAGTTSSQPSSTTSNPGVKSFPFMSAIPFPTVLCAFTGKTAASAPQKMLTVKTSVSVSSFAAANASLQQQFASRMVRAEQKNQTVASCSRQSSDLDDDQVIQ
jgi:hypothetical protein